MNEKNGKNIKSYSRISEEKTYSTAPVRSSQMSADERIVHRTNARKRKNRRKKIIARAVMGTLFFLAATILVLVLFFNINTINVTGDDIYSAADITEASGVKIGDNLIFVSSKKVNKRLTESLAYIGSVKIKRHLPATLEIVVTKTVAEYAVMTDGRYALFDGSGKVLEKDLDFVNDSIIVANLGKITSAEIGKTAVLEDEKVFGKLLELKKAFSDSGIDGITSADITNIYDIKLVYEGRITLILGETDKNSLIHKLSLAKEAIKTQNEENSSYRGTINLTVNGKAYWAEETVTENNSSSEPEKKPEESTSAAA